MTTGAVTVVGHRPDGRWRVAYLLLLGCAIARTSFRVNRCVGNGKSSLCQGLRPTAGRGGRPDRKGGQMDARMLSAFM